MKQLSFASASSPAASQPEQDSLVKKASFDPAPPSQSEQCFFGSASAAPENAEQMVPASLQQEAEASPQQEAASSSHPSPPAAKPALPQPGSRITYEARQRLHPVYADESQEVIGSVGKGLLVVPGGWARLSNISESGTWLSDESFKVGEKLITRTRGSSAGRIKCGLSCPQLEHPGSSIHLDDGLLLFSVQ